MGFETVSAVVLKERLQGDEKCLIVDVRTPGEFQGTHVQDAVNIPLDRLTADQVQAKCNGSERKIYILCQSGGRSRLIHQEEDWFIWKQIQTSEAHDIKAIVWRK